MVYARHEQLRLLYFRSVSATVSDAQWKFYADTFERDSALPGEPPFAIVFESTVGSAIPNARWRKRFAEVGTKTREDATFILVTTSPLARAVVRAVNWFRPFRFHHAVVTNTEFAIELIAHRRADAGVRVAFAGMLAHLIAVPGD